MVFIGSHASRSHHKGLNMGVSDIVVFSDGDQRFLGDCEEQELDESNDHEIVRENNSRYPGVLLKYDMACLDPKDVCAVVEGDCLSILQELPDNSVDLIFTSPPYESARRYDDLDFNLSGKDYVRWALPRYLECVRVCRGLVAWVLEGRTRNFRWSAVPAMLMADLHRAGVKLRKPPIYQRVGIPGSGGPDWWRNDYEFVICSSKGKLPWSDNTASGNPPKFKPGGQMSHRTVSGRVNDKASQKAYKPPSKANPGNVIKLTVGGGHMGSDFAHENEAPFPESLVEPFVLSFCRPDGLVLDPFCGSGTTLAVALRHGRGVVGLDIRKSQVKLSRKRLGLDLC